MAFDSCLLSKSHPSQYKLAPFPQWAACGVNQGVNQGVVVVVVMVVVCIDNTLYTLLMYCTLVGHASEDTYEHANMPTCDVELSESGQGRLTC